MKEVSLLQNDHSVQEMLIQKMYPHCCPSSCLSWASLYQALPCGRGFPDLSLLCRLSMMCHTVPLQISSYHILPALPAIYPYHMLLLVGWSLSRHPLPVRRLRLVIRRLAWAADHANCLPGVSPQAHPIGKVGQGIKCTLEL